MKGKSMEKVNIGMVGFGYIAHGVFELISKQGEYIAKKTGKEQDTRKVRFQGL